MRRRRPANHVLGLIEAPERTRKVLPGIPVADDQNGRRIASFRMLPTVVATLSPPDPTTTRVAVFGQRTRPLALRQELLLGLTCRSERGASGTRRHSAEDSGPVEPEDPSAQGAERLGDLRTDPEGVAVSRTSQSRTARIQAKRGQSANNGSSILGTVSDPRHR